MRVDRQRGPYTPQNQSEYKLASLVLKRRNRRFAAGGLLGAGVLSAVGGIGAEVGNLLGNVHGISPDTILGFKGLLAFSAAATIPYAMSIFRGREMRKLADSLPSGQNPLIGKVKMDRFWDNFSDILTVASILSIFVPILALVDLPFVLVKGIDIIVGHRMNAEAQGQKKRYKRLHPEVK